MTANGYAVDRLTPVRHVASELDRAAPAALSVAELTASYRHPNTGDLARVTEHEGRSDAEAWLIEQAVDSLRYAGATARSRPQLAEDDGRLSLAVPFGELVFSGKKLHALHNEHALLGDPFNKMSGIFAENIRLGKQQPSPETDDELRESMRGGWLPGHPAVKDERGVIIVGHRRLAIAEELGIEPRIERVTFGDGDAGDVERLRVAVLSNQGAKPLSKTDRARIAEYLTERGWTQPSIAEALNVAQSTISNDLRGIIRPDNSSKRGRPRKVDDPALNNAIRRRKEAGQPVNSKELGQQFGVSKGTVDAAAVAVDREDDWDTAFQALIRLAGRDRLLQMKQAIDGALAALES